MIRVTDPSGADIGDLSTKSFISLVYTRKLNTIGTLTLKFPYSNKLFRMFKAETTLGVYRKLPGVGYTIDGNTRWFVRKITDNTDQQGGRYLEIEAYDAMTLLERRYMAYNQGNEYTTKVDYADDMAKTIMNENFGALALEEERDISDYLEIDVERSLCSAIYKEFQRETLLASLQSIVDTSKDYGTTMYFDILYVPESKTFIFKTFLNQRGIDLRIDNYGLKSVVLGETYNNLSNITADYDYTKEANYVYVGGSGVGDIAAIASVYDPKRIAASPYGRIETYKSGVSTASVSELKDEAKAELSDRAPRIKIEGKVRDIEGTKYGIHYYLGDRVTVVYNDNYFDVDVESVTTTVTEAGESVEITLSEISQIISATGNIPPPSPPPLPPNPPPTPPNPIPPTPPPSPPVWIEIYPPGGPPANDYWMAAASDSDGSNLIVGSSYSATRPGRLYISTDFGVTWTETYPPGGPPVDKHWDCVASDATGLHLIAGVSPGRLYTSANGGVNWTERNPPGGAAIDRAWHHVASDSDGSFLMASIGSGRLYTSSNYGVNWTERYPPGGAPVDQSWSVASDSTGLHLIAGGSYRLYTSANSGVSWTERYPPGGAPTDKSWTPVASDSDGTNLMAAGRSGGFNARLYTSSNSGATWVERQPAGNLDINWNEVASDSIGLHLIAVVYLGRVYISANGGVNWTETQPNGDTNLRWHSVASDSDGSNLIAGVAPGRLYIYK